MSSTGQICNVTCQKCNAKNRIPEARLEDGPKCGKCKAPIFNGKPVEINSSNVAAIINHNDIPVLVDCWAPWCGPCQGFAPIFEQAAKELEPRLRLAKLDTEANEQIGSRWKIRSIPTLILFKNGKEVARQSGAMSMQGLRKWVSGLNLG